LGKYNYEAENMRLVPKFRERLATGGWRMATGGWRLANGNWRLAFGYSQLAKTGWNNSIFFFGKVSLF